jgi:hypothetical protein
MHKEKGHGCLKLTESFFRCLVTPNLLLTLLMLDVDFRFFRTCSKFSHLLFLPLRTMIGFQRLATKLTGWFPFLPKHRSSFSAVYIMNSFDARNIFFLRVQTSAHNFCGIV